MGLMYDMQCVGKRKKRDVIRAISLVQVNVDIVFAFSLQKNRIDVINSSI